jgi:outer membrane protein TolC
LPEAIGLALQNNPRLRAALAAIERARGQETVAFAPFLPQIDMLNRFVAQAERWDILDNSPRATRSATSFSPSSTPAAGPGTCRW